MTMASSNLTAPSVTLTEAEADVLALFDQLQILQLELGLLQSKQKHHVPDGASSQDAGLDPAGDQTHLLDATATFALRNSVVESVVAVQPTLNAVHRAVHASPAERNLLPYIEQRDMAAVNAAAVCSDLQAARGRLAELEVASLHASHRNTQLASELLQLTKETQDQQPKRVAGGQFQKEITDLKDQVKSSRHRWRVMKGAASAIVAGSGTDWARDERLRGLVLDPPD